MYRAVSEAIRLRLDDITADGLEVYRTKFARVVSSTDPLLLLYGDFGR